MYLKSINVLGQTVELDMVRYYSAHFVLQSANFRHSDKFFRVDIVHHENDLSIMVNDTIVVEGESFDSYFDYKNKILKQKDVDTLISLAVARQLSGTMFDFLMNHHELIQKCRYDGSHRFISYVDNTIGSILGGIIVQRRTSDNSGFQVYYMVKGNIVRSSPWQSLPFNHDDIGTFIRNLATIDNLVYDTSEYPYDEDGEDDDC